MWHFGNKQGDKGTVTSLPLECEPDRGGGDLRCKLSDCTDIASVV